MGKHTLGFCMAAAMMLTAGAATATSFTQVAGGPERSLARLQAGSSAIYMFAGDRLFKSINSGSSWTAVGGLPPRAPSDIVVAGSTLFAATIAGVYRSQDDGASWELFNGSGSALLSSLKIESIHATDSAVFVVTRDSGSNNSTVLSRSATGSAAWSTVTPPSIGQDGVTDMVTAGSNVCILVGNSGMRYSTDGGVTWASSSGVSGQHADVAVSPADGSVVYVATFSGGLRRSTNSCVSFLSPTATGLANQTGRNVSALGVNASGAVFAGLTDGTILSSSDNGANFSAANSGSLPAPTGIKFASFLPVSGGILAASEGGGVHFKSSGDWQARNSGLRSSGLNQLLDGGAIGSLLIGHEGGVLITTDGGVNFSDLNSGLGKRLVRALLRDGNTLIAGSDSGTPGTAPSLFRSTDGGSSWTQLQAVASGLPTAAGFNGLEKSGSTYLAIVSGAETTDLTGIYRSTDGGLAWTRSVAGLPTAGVSGFSYRNLAVAGNGDVYLYLANNGVYRSTDGGLNWTVASSGLGGNRQGKVFAVGDALFASASGIVYRSTNNGGSWTATTGFAVSKFVIEILSMARDAAGHLYMGDEHAGLSISKDDGLTWTPDSDGLARSEVCIARINALLVKDGKVYAAQGEGGGLRVADPVGDGTPGDSVDCTTTVDAFPNPFSFTTQNNVTPNQFAQSNAVSINGLGSGVTVPVSVSGGEYSLGCNGTFTAQAGTTGNSLVCVRHMTPNLSETPTSTTLVVGDESSTFTTRTGLVYNGRDDEINTAYGSNGFAPVTGTNGAASDVLVQPDGKIVLAGTTLGSGFSNRFAVARRNADGTPDAGFGANGLVSLTIADNDTLSAVLRQSDGKLVLIGQTLDFNGTPQNGNDDINALTLARLNADGSLDSGFGNAGIVKLDINPNDSVRSEQVVDGKILGDGSILVAGSVTTSNAGERFFIVKFNTAGIHQTVFGNASSTFGSNPVKPHFITGVAQVQVNTFGSSQAAALLVQSDAKLVVVGTSTPSGQASRGVVARFSPAGAVDTYGTNGVATVNNPGLLTDAALLAGDKLLVVGGSNNQGFLARLNAADGSLDTAFASSGTRILSGLSTGRINRVIVLSDGRLSILGSGTVDGSSGILFSILSANAAYDPNFGPGGRGFVIRGPINGQTIGGNAIAERGDGGVVVGGSFNPSGTNLFSSLVFGGDTQTTPPGPDTTPNAFSFVNQTGVARNIEITSAAVTITGIEAAASVQVTGGSYSVGCGVSYITTAGSIANNQTVCVRHTSSNLFSGNTDTVLTVGGVSATFRSTTLAQDTAPDMFTLVDQDNVEPASTVTSAPITVAGINVPTTITVSEGGSYSIGSGAFTAAAGMVSGGDSVRVRHTAAATTTTAVNTTLTIGGVSDIFTSNTRAPLPPMADTTPDAFSFTDATGAQPGATVTSNEITVLGINQPVAISVSGGEYRIGQGAFTALAGTISAGQGVSVRGTAGALGATVNVTLNVGGVMDLFSITTANELAGTVAPDGLSGTVADVGGRAVEIDTAAGQLQNLRRVVQPAGVPGGVSFPNGFFAFDIGGLANGASTQVTIDLPVGVRASSYVKCIAGTCRKLPPAKAVIAGSVITLTLTDGDPETDADGLANGTIVDPGAPAVDDPVSSGGGALGWGLLALFGLAGLRRRRARA